MCAVLRKEYILKFFFNDVRVKLCGVFGKRSNDKAIFGNVSVSIFGNISGKYLTKFICYCFYLPLWEHGLIYCVSMQLFQKEFLQCFYGKFFIENLLMITYLSSMRMTIFQDHLWQNNLLVESHSFNSFDSNALII